MTLKESRSFIKTYQEKLGLSDWRISLRYAKDGEEDESVSAAVFWCTELGTARIILNKHEEDVEHTLVHELLHVVLEGHNPRPNKYDAQYERGINRVAEAILGRKTVTSPILGEEMIAKRRSINGFHECTSKD